MCVFILFSSSSLIIHVNISLCDTTYCTTSFYFVQLTMDDGSSEKSFDKMIIAATKPWYYYYYCYCYRYHYYCCCYCYYFCYYHLNYSFDSLQKPCCHFRLNNKPDLNPLMPNSDLQILLCLTPDDFTRQRETPWALKG